VTGNFHARFWIGGEESDLLADHTKNGSDAKESVSKKADLSGVWNTERTALGAVSCWGSDYGPPLWRE
jgi:hypothetical protein